MPFKFLLLPHLEHLILAQKGKSPVSRFVDILISNYICNFQLSDVAISLMVQSNESWQKAVPLQAWSGPEGSRKLRFPDFKTTAQDGGKVVSLMHRPPLPPGNTPGTHFC
jgi:hypothetical protein